MASPQPGLQNDTVDLNLRLLLAVQGGDVDELRSLVDAGGDPSTLHPTVRLSALCFACEHDQPQVLVALIEAGADVNWRSEQGWTALHHAVDAEGDLAAQAGKPLDLRLIQPLLDAGADATVTYNGDTALDVARVYGHRLAVEAILDRAGRKPDG